MSEVRTDWSLEGLAAKVTLPGGREICGEFRLSASGVIRFESVSTENLSLLSPGGLAPDEPSVLRGVSLDGRLLTLFDTFWIGCDVGPAGICRLQLLVNRVVVGAHFTSSGDHTISRVATTPPGLAELLGHRGLVDRSRSGSSGRVHGFEYIPMPEVNVAVHRRCDPGIAIEISDTVTSQITLVGRAALVVAKEIGIRYRSPVSLDIAIQDLDAVCRLLALFSGREMPLEFVTLEGPSIPSAASLVLPPPGRGSDKVRVPHLPWSAVLPIFGEIARRWFDERQWLMHAVALYRASAVERPTFLEDRLMAAFACMDRIGREVERRCAAPTSSAHKLSCGLQPTAGTGCRRSTLERVLEAYPPELCGELRSWATNQARVIQALRNSIAHGDPESALPLAPTQSIMTLTNLRKVLWSVLLYELGVPIDQIVAASARLPRAI